MFQIAFVGLHLEILRTKTFECARIKLIKMHMMVELSYHDLY